jgi:uncharacterized protein YjbI with pentapeptide repeats
MSRAEIRDITVNDASFNFDANTDYINVNFQLDAFTFNLNNTKITLSDNSKAPTASGYKYLADATGVRYVLGPGVNLTDVDLTDVDLLNVDLTGADLRGVTFSNTKVSLAAGSTVPDLGDDSGYVFMEDSVRIKHLLGPGMTLANINLLRIFVIDGSRNIPVPADKGPDDIEIVFVETLGIPDLSAYDLTGLQLSLSAESNTPIVPSDSGYKFVRDKDGVRHLVGPNIRLNDVHFNYFSDFRDADLTDAHFENTTIFFGPETRTNWDIEGKSAIFPKSSNNYQFIDDSLGEYEYLVGPGMNWSANLRNKSFSDLDLSRVNLTGATFSNTELSLRAGSVAPTVADGYTFIPDKNNIRHLIGPGMNVMDVDFDSLSLGYFNLTNGVTFQNTTLRLAYGSVRPAVPEGYKFGNFNGVDYLVGPNMNLKDVNLRNMNIVGLIGSKTPTENQFNLLGVDLSTATFSKTILRILHYLPLERPILPDARYFFIGDTVAHLIGPGVHLKDADLTDMSIGDADLTGGDFTQNVTFHNTLVSLASYSQTPTVPEGYVFVRDSTFVGDADINGIRYLVGPSGETNLDGADFTGTDYEHIVKGEKHYLIGPDTTALNVDLSNQNLTEATFSNTKVSLATGTTAPLIPTNYEFIADATGVRYLVGPRVKLTNVDLDGVDLSGLLLTNVNLSGAKLTGATFSNTKVSLSAESTVPTIPTNYEFIADATGVRYLLGSNVNLSNVDLREANLTGVVVSNVDLTNLDLSGATFSNAKVSLATGSTAPALPPPYEFVKRHYGPYHGTYLVGPSVNLSDVDLTDAILRYSNLNNANLSGATLTNANVVGIKLREANLTGVVLSNVDMSNADLTGATFSNTRLSLASGSTAPTISTEYKFIENGSGVNYLVGPKVNLSNADLTGATLTNVNLTDANLSDADLSNATLTNLINFVPSSTTKLDGATLKNLTIDGADFSSADLTTTTFENVKGKNLTIYSEVTQLPVHFSVRSGFLLGPGVNLSGETLPPPITMKDVVLTDANLDNATCDHVNFQNADLSRSTINGAKLNFAKMRQCTFQRTQMGNVTTNASTTLPDGYVARGGFVVGPDSDLSNQNLSGIDLSYLDLNNADLSGATVTNAIMTGSTMPLLTVEQFASLHGDFTGSIFRQDMDLGGLDLTKAVTIDNTTLTNRQFMDVLAGGNKSIETKNTFSTKNIERIQLPTSVGENAEVTATLTDNQLTNITINNGGSGYSNTVGLSTESQQFDLTIIENALGKKEGIMKFRAERCTTLIRMVSLQIFRVLVTSPGKNYFKTTSIEIDPPTSGTPIMITTNTTITVSDASFFRTGPSERKEIILRGKTLPYDTIDGDTIFLSRPHNMEDLQRGELVGQIALLRPEIKDDVGEMTEIHVDHGGYGYVEVPELFIDDPFLPTYDDGDVYSIFGSANISGRYIVSHSEDDGNVTLTIDAPDEISVGHTEVVSIGSNLIAVVDEGSITSIHESTPLVSFSTEAIQNIIINEVSTYALQTDVWSTEFTDINFRNFSFSGRHIVKCSFQNVDMRGCDFIDTVFVSCTFENSNLSASLTSGALFTDSYTIDGTEYSFDTSCSFDNDCDLRGINPDIHGDSTFVRLPEGYSVDTTSGHLKGPLLNLKPNRKNLTGTSANLESGFEYIHGHKFGDGVTTMDVRHIDLSHREFSNATFINLTHVRLNDSTFTNCTFIGTLDAVDFRGSTFVDYNFLGVTSLKDPTFGGASFSRTSTNIIQRAWYPNYMKLIRGEILLASGNRTGKPLDLTDVDLTGARLDNVDLTRATLSGVRGVIASADNLILPDEYSLIEMRIVGPNVHLSGALGDLRSAVLRGVQSEGVTSAILPRGYRIKSGRIIGKDAIWF